ncbi:MAG: DDE-type integrase/transposase/recombinase [Planctomycetota bacterium]|jgi:transposase InsO family protein
MTDETRDQIALFRYKLISPVLAEPARAQNAYFRRQAELDHNVPHYGVRRFQLSTMKGWLRKYRRKGIKGLRPKPRADLGRPRRLDDNAMEAIRIRCKAYPHYTVTMLYLSLQADGLLGEPPLCYGSLLRIVRQERLLDGTRKRSDARKRYEMDRVNELWVCDFMHGPTVQSDRRRKKAILCAIIDDHSRMVVGHAFSAHETVSALTVVLKEAFSAFGVPRRLYVDNGPSFSSDLLAQACAGAGISLIHSKPYDSPSRGKVERFFRTVRERFLSTITEELTLDALNDAFTRWLKDDYHHRHHTGIDQRPIDRYHASSAQTDIRRLARAELDEIFLIRHERLVNNDATISFKGNIYEVPAAYIRQRVELRHPVDDDAELWLYDAGQKVARLKLVDARENARVFRPTQAAAPFSFTRAEPGRP